MPIRTFDFSNIPVLRDKDSPLGDVFSKAVEGYYQGKEGKENSELTAQKIQSEKMANALMQKYGEQEKLAKIAHREALAKRYEDGYGSGGNNSGGALSVPAKLLRDRQQIAEKYGENSKELKFMDEYLKKAQTKQQGSSGVTSPVKTAQQNAMIANEMRNFIAENLEMPYIGEYSNIEINNDISKYKSTKDPVLKQKLREKLAKAGNAEKIAPEYAILQILGQGNKASIDAQKEQRKAIKQGWPESTHFRVNNLPKEIQQDINVLHSKTLKQLSDIRERTYKKFEGSEQSSPIEGMQGIAADLGADEYGWTQEDYEATAEKHNQSVEDVKKWVQGAR